MTRTVTDPFTQAERMDLQRAEHHWDMSYIDESNIVRYKSGRVLVGEDILDLLYCHGYISANQREATINHRRSTV
jgi:hypothetical protein